jgi:tetratricopeptide (TPR) repeat protein
LVRRVQFAPLAGIALLAALPLIARGQEPTARLMDEPPFDILTLDRANDSKVLKLYPVPLPGRRVPERPRASEKIRVRLMETGEEYDVAWEHIDKLELYEQMVLAEARRFTTAGRLDDAYDTLEFLFEFYPQTPGLADARQAYLYASSAAAFRQQKYDEALALLEELLAQNPNYRAGESSAPLLSRLDAIADRLISTHVQAQDYRAARTLLTRLAKQYKAENEPFAKKWTGELARSAAARLAEAQSHFTSGQFVQAQDACAAAAEIWPDVPGLAKLMAEVAKRHPLVRVGVAHPARGYDSLSLHDPAARRAGALLSPLLVERTALGLEGGKYASPLATLETSDDGSSLTLRLNSAGTNWSYPITEHLLSRALPTSSAFDPTWAQMISSVALVGLEEIRIDFRSAPILPEARLQIPLARIAESAEAPYKILSSDAAAVRYTAISSSLFHQPGQPAEVIERYFNDPQRALIALKRGEIDILDHVFPGDIPALRADTSLAVEPYRGPTTHVLAVRSEEPYLHSATFRRALLYSANRDLLLSQGILRGAVLPGFRLTSSPFPAPAPGLELPAYAYDERIEPRAYDPPLGKALVLLAENELRSAFQKQEKQAPKRRTLVLGHPADEISRIACRGLAKDWKRVGVESRLVEFPPGVFDDAKQECDLVYLQLAAWEPLLDAARLFSPDGLTPSTLPAIQLLLRQIESSPNWPEARRRLTTLHRLIHEDLTVLPLWQTQDYYAVRRGSLPTDVRRLALYQDIDRWRPGSAPPRTP